MAAVDPCAQLPPASSDYAAKGTWDTVADLETYVISAVDKPTRAVVLIYDAFGRSPQTLQGADRLAAALGALVLVPDFFRGDCVRPEWMPADTDEKKARFQRWRTERAAVPDNLDALLAVRDAAAARWPSVAPRAWGVFGLCWGGKISVVACGKGNEGGQKFAVGGTAHPGALDAQDAEALSVPYICLASPGEPADVVAQYKEILSRPGKVGVVETYETMFHGWMGARAKLDDEQNRAEYERGYTQVGEFFEKYL